MANIKLKGLLTEAEDFKARSKETGKLVHFKSKDAYQAALKAGSHEDPKAEKDKGSKVSTKPNDMFGGDYAKDRAGEPKSDGMATVNSIAAKTGLRAQAVAGWADENGVNLSKVSDDLQSKKLKPFDFTTAVVGKPGNNYSKAIIAKYSNNKTSADVKSIVKGILKTADKEFAGTHKLKDITDDITVDTSDNDGKELQARIDKGEDGIYVQTGETEGTVVFKDGTQYQFSHVEDGPIPVTKVGGNASNAEKSKYDNTSYWKDDEYSDTQGYIDSDDEDSEEDDDYDEEGSDVRLTSDRLSKVEKALEDDLNLRGNGFETTRESSGGGGGWEGPMTIVSKDTDYNDEDNYISLSVGSPNNDGKFSIVFANSNGEPYFEPNYDALTGDIDLEPQQAYKVTKALMKMPEVQKLLKGEMNREEFQPIYDKLKAKFSKGKTESTKLTSMIKR